MAIVVDNKDGDSNPGYRVKVKYPWLNEQDTSFWARIVVPMGGAGRGTYVLPEIDDQVLVVFEHGDFDRPLVVGALWSKQQEPVEVNQSGKNNTKLIKSRSGHRLIFDDKEGAERIVIVDKTKKNKIVLDAANKIVKVESDGDIEIIAKANVILHANAHKIGTTEGITGKGRSLLVHAQKMFGLKAANAITIGGGSTTINTSNAAATSVSGSGAGELAGAPPETPKDQIVANQAGGGSSGRANAAQAGAASSGAAAQAVAAAVASNATITSAIDAAQIEVGVFTFGGELARGTSFELVLPDGTIKKGDVPADGVIRFSDLTQSGSCKLTFPGVKEDLDHTTAAAAGRLPYSTAANPVVVPIGQFSQVELPPRSVRARLVGMFCETDKSFLLPGAMAGIRQLVDFYKQHPNYAALFSGHADTQGTAEYNRLLSVERAVVMQAYLVDDADTWDDRFTKQQPAGQRWGTRETQHMLTKLPEQSTPFYAATVDGIHGPKSQQAVKDFQAWNNQVHGTSLKLTGNVDAATRKEIIKAYMTLDGTSLPKGTTTDHHGCGEFHLADPTADNVDDQKNRRIEVYFFEGKIKPPPVAKCPPGGCQEYPIWRDGIDDELDLDVAGADGRAPVAILIVDELGIPLKKHGVHMKRADGQEFDAETDGDGKVHPLLLPGESVELTIDDCQEVGVGDSITTPSGHHFGANLPGPRP